MVERIGRWVAKNTPTREDMARNRWTRPFANRSDLWRFTRRSVPRGVGVGLLVGIFLMVPGLQIVGAALLSLPFRANIPIAAGMTFLSNPLTTPFFLVAALVVGNRLGFRADLDAFYALYGRGSSVGEWTAWLFSDAAPALVSGLFVIASACAILGYVVTVFGWRWWTATKWRRRRARLGQ